MFRASGEEFEVEAFLREFALTPYDQWRRGTPRGLRGKLYQASGFSCVASEAFMDQFDQQVTDTIAFIHAQPAWLRAIASYPGVEQAIFDFGIDMPGGVIPMVTFPPALLSAIGPLGVALEVSLYQTSDNSDEPRS